MWLIKLCCIDRTANYMAIKLLRLKYWGVLCIQVEKCSWYIAYPTENFGSMLKISVAGMILREERLM